MEIVIYDWPAAHAQAKFSSSTYPLKTTYDEKQHALHVMLSDVTGEAELTRARENRALIRRDACCPVKIDLRCFFPSSANSSRTLNSFPALGV